MDPTIIVAIIAASATVVAAIIGHRSGKKQGIQQGSDEKQREIDDAPRKYVDHLDALITDALREGHEKASVNARAIVSTRNELRESTIKISDRLNSEIDMLEKQLKRMRSSELMETIEVLAKKWPAKKDQIEIELRKVLAEMGLLGKAPRHTQNRNLGQRRNQQKQRDEDEDDRLGFAPA